MTEIYKTDNNVNRVRNKPKAAPRRSRNHIWIVAPAILLFIAATTLGYDLYYGRLGLIGSQSVIAESQPVIEESQPVIEESQPVIEEATAGRVIRVPPGGSVQAAIQSASGGDTVELVAGAVYPGPVILPNKPITEFITIRSSFSENLPADRRISSAQRTSMAKIVSGPAGSSAIEAANGAHHFRFVGIEFAPGNSSYTYAIISLGSGEANPNNVPHDIEIDRSYIHPNSSGTTRRGIALNSANTIIKNSYIEGIAFPGEETQGICGWTGSRNVQIINNYIEAGAENIMFGGSDPANAELIPSDIEIRGNHLNKPVEWRERVTVKTLFELKNAKRVTFTENLLTNNWKGSALRLTVRNQDNNAPFSTIEDVTIKNNIISGAGEGINILGKDDTYPSQTLKRLVIENNVLLGLRDGNGFEGSGYFVQVSDGEGITIAHNTVFNNGNIATFYGTMPRGFAFRDNITGHGNYGVHGLDVKSGEARRMFFNNLFINNLRVSEADASFPAGNFWLSDFRLVGFVNLEQNDLALSPASKFKGRSTTKTDLGCDVSLLPMDALRSFLN